MTALYVRVTREVSFEALPEALRGALAGWASRRQCSLDGVRVWHTRSENPPGRGLFARVLGRRSNPVDPNAFHDAALLLHPTQLVVASVGEKSAAMAMGVALAQATVTRGSPLAAKPGASAPSDDGISIEGFPGAPGRPGQWFFGMGAPDADACFAAVVTAVRAARAG